MKEKILAAIKAKYPAINLSKKRLEAIAAKIEEKVIDDESKIDAALALYNEYNPLADMASNDDKLRTAEKKLKETTPAPKDPKEKEVETPAAQTPTTVPEDAPAYVKAMMEQMGVMSKALTGMQAEKAAGSIKSKAEAALKDVPVKFWGKRQLPTKDEELEAFIAEVNDDYKEFGAVQTEKGLSFTPKPVTGVQPNATDKKVPDELKAFFERKQAVEKQNPVVQPQGNAMIIK